jgi:hypothetical protein
MTERQQAIGIFDNTLDTEVALTELDKSNYSLNRVFVIARDTDGENKVVDTQLCQSLRDRFKERISSIARQDSSIIKGEPVISLTQALVHLDIPVDTACVYNQMVAGGKYLVMVEGNTQDITGAQTILKSCGIQEWVIYKIVSEHPEVIIVDRRSYR